MTLVGLANAVGTKYPNLSAIENDRRTVGLTMARKLGEVLGVDYQKFIE
jgi:plasmid maintenance system antidote protein VapI